jgi:hypothetical protein
MPDNVLDKKLAESLHKHPVIGGVLKSIKPDSLREQDKTMIKWLDEKVESYLKSDKELLNNWKKYSNWLKDAIKIGAETDRTVLAAAILAGAAIAREDIFLRGDLDASLQQQRADYQENYGSGDVTPGSSQPGGPAGSYPPSGNPPSVFATKLANDYKNLTANITPNGKLDSAIKELLTDPNKVLRVGWRLYNLNINSLEEALDEHFGETTIHHASGGPREGTDQKSNWCWAANNISLKAEDFTCMRRQEKSASDEIFWTGFFYSIANLEEVYGNIDTAITNNADIELNIQWTVRNWRSQLKSINEQESPVELNENLFQFNIHNGFCPWVANLICIEDDDAEYEAIGDTLDTIGDYAGAVGHCASVVAAVSGPTVLAAGAGAVASASKFVSIACDTAGAIVDIVNHFDENDVIGNITLYNQDDYAKEKESDVAQGDLESEPYMAEENNSGGCYYINLVKHYEGKNKFHRTWRYEQRTIEGDWKHHNPWGWHGGSGEDSVNLKFPVKVNKDIFGTVEVPNEGHDRHAEWVKGPTLGSDERTITGKVHWGVRADHSIKYKVHVTGLRFLHHL